ncbi:SDR family NAD(P)-dependent oxidoreductase [Knoellia sp. CPCC 206453]|uniref:SDR family NAD(P)-dependent oxidoreductase n=1 Tax=Knoellia pratensis TaxID=3404796 RepID=UPI00361809BB
MKTALITGANRGIGRAVAQQLADQGMTVIVGARDTAAGEAAAQEIGRGAMSVQLDVTDPASITAAALQISRTHGSLDVLVNNAGILPEATNADPTESVDLEMFRQTYATNVLGPVGVLEAFLPLLRTSPAGRIVNVSSTVGSLSDQTNPESPYYSMVLPAYQSSKAALNNITIALAKQLADTPITVTSVCPGFVQTDLTPINHEQAPLTADQAAVPIVVAATLPEGAASGTFIDANGPVAW